MQRHGEIKGSLSTSDNVANLARLPGFQQCLEIDYTKVQLPGWKTFHHWPGASPATRLGAIPWQDQGNLSTAVNVANLVRAPGFQHCLEPDYVTHRSITTRLKNFPSLTWSLTSHKTGCNSMARSGKSFNGRQCCQPGTGARFSTFSVDHLTTILSEPQTGGTVGWNGCFLLRRQRHLHQIRWWSLLSQWSQRYCSCIDLIDDPTPSHRYLAYTSPKSLCEATEVTLVSGVLQCILETAVGGDSQFRHGPISWCGRWRGGPWSW